MKKIILIGMMGSGKSATARKLSSIFNISNYELDEIFEKKYSKITDYFKNFGEDDFRLKESTILAQTLKNPEYIISTGGGIILKKENRDLIFTPEITSIYLKTSVETIYKRIKDDTTRPLLLVSDPKKEIEKILEKRKKYYELANYTITTDNLTPEEVAKEIAKIYERNSN